MSTLDENPQSLLAHDAFVRALARRLLRNEADAEDAVQHAAIAALKAPPRAVASLRSWLAAVIHNYARDLHRASTARAARERQGARTEVLPSTDDLLAREAARRLVVETVTSLDEPWRTTLLLHYFDNKSVREIADICNISVQTVKTRVHRGLQLARVKLDQKFRGERGLWCTQIALLAYAKPPLVLVTILESSRKSAECMIMASGKVKFTAVAAALLILTGSIWYITDQDRRPRESLVAGGELAADGTPRDPAPPVDAPDARAGDSRRAAATPKSALQYNLQNGRGSIRGRVVEANGAPVGGARVERLGASHEFLTSSLYQFLDGGGPPAPAGSLDTTITDSSGIFEFRRVAPHESWLLAVNAGAQRPTLRFLDAEPSFDEVRDVGDIVMDPPRTLAAKICYHDGKPAANARVLFTNLPAPLAEAGLEFLLSKRSFILDPAWLGAQVGGGPKIIFTPPEWLDALRAWIPFPSTRTGADGTFVIHDAPKGNIYMYVDAPGAPPAFVGPITSTEGSILQYTIKAPLTVRGKVVTPEGAPVPHAEVWPAVPSPIYQSDVAFLEKPVRADADGNFTILDHGSILVKFAVRAPGAVSWNITESMPSADPAIRIQTSAPSAFYVRILDINNKPVDGNLLFFHTGGTIDSSPTSDEMAAVESISAAEDYKLSMDIGRTRLLNSPVPREGTYSSSITIAPAADNSNPAAVRTLELEYANRKLQFITSLPLLHHFGSKVSAPETADPWVFTWTPVHPKITKEGPGYYKIENLSKGSYRVVARAGDLAPAASDFYLSGAPNFEVPLSLSVAATLGVHVTQGEGPASRPVGGARISVSSHFASLPLTAPADASSTAGADGNVIFKNLQREVKRVTISHPDFAASVADVNLNIENELYVSLKEGGSIRGIILNNGAPSESVAVVLRPDHVDPFFNFWRTTTAADGSFTFHHIPPGGFEVLVGKRLLPLPNAAGDVLREWIDDRARESHPCTIENGKVTEITIDLARPERPALRGRVMVNGNPAANYPFSASGQFGDEPRFHTNENGEFDLGQATPDSYQLKLYYFDNISLPMAKASVEIVRGQPFYYNWNITTGALEGTIRREDGSVASGATVVVRKKGGESRFERQLMTDETGHYVIPVVMPGDYYTYAVVDEQRARPVAVHVVEGSSATANIQLQKCCEFSGRISAPGLEGAQQITIHLRPLDNEDPFALRPAEVGLENLDFHFSGLRKTRWSMSLRAVLADGSNITYTGPEVSLPAENRANPYEFHRD